MTEYKYSGFQLMIVTLMPILTLLILKAADYAVYQSINKACQEKTAPYIPMMKDGVCYRATKDGGWIPVEEEDE